MNIHLRKTSHIEKTPSQHNQNHLKSEGQSLVEFALILGLIVVIFIGAVDIFNLLQQKADLDKMILQAARQAGEFGGAGDGNEIEAYIRAQMDSMNYSPTEISDALITLDLAPYKYESGEITPVELAERTTLGLGDNECLYGQFISVTIEVPWNTNIPSVLFFNEFNGSGTFRIQSTARCWRAL